jgi:Zn-dependent metalloprotease
VPHRTARAARLPAAALAVVALGAVVTAPAASPASPATVAGVAAPAASAGEIVRLVRDGAGRVRLLAAGGARAPGRQAGLTAETAARRHLDRVGATFGIRPGDLRTMSVTRVSGRDLVRFQQTRDGLPVLGGQLVTVLDGRGGLLSVSGETARQAGPAPAYRVEASTAARTARRAVAASHGLPASALVAGRPTRWLLDPSLVEPAATPVLRSVWRVPVRSPSRLDVADLVLVDARTGRVALRLAETAGLDRVVCDDLRTDSYRCHAGLYDRVEGGPATGTTDADQAYDLSGVTADWYASALGVDLTALIGSDFGDGRKLRSTTNYCPPGACPLDNAFWTGNQMVYGAGYTSADDVVAHELTHGVTQHTAGLVYWYQSGSINESMSDVLGELVDQADGIGNDAPETKWRLGEDLPPSAGGTTRDMADPTRYLQPDTTSSPLFDFAQDYDDSGAVHTNSGVPNKAAYLITDGTVAEPGGAFLGRAFPGIGPAHAATLYWTALQMLTPGSDFVDLAAALQQACTTLALPAAECATVAAAVEVTGLGRWAGPTVPRAVRMTAGTGVVRLSWSPPASSGSVPLGSYVVAVTPAVHGDGFVTVEPKATEWVLTGLRPGANYAVRLMAVTAEGTSPAVVRTFAGTTLTVAAPATPVWGSRVHVTGRLLDAAGVGLPGRRVELLRRDPGSPAYRVVETVPTRADGVFGFGSWRARRSTDWYLRYGGGGGELGVRGQHQTTVVRQRVNLGPADLTVRPGDALHLSGVVQPARGGVVALQRLGPGGAWVTVAQARLVERTGSWELGWRVRTARPLTLRVRVGARPRLGLAAGTSRAVLLNAR